MDIEKYYRIRRKFYEANRHGKIKIIDIPLRLRIKLMWIHIKTKLWLAWH